MKSLQDRSEVRPSLIDLHKEKRKFPCRDQQNIAGEDRSIPRRREQRDRICSSLSSSSDDDNDDDDDDEGSGALPVGPV